MKKIRLIVVFLLLSSPLIAQERYYGIVGYGGAFKTFNNAYTNYTKNDLPADLTSLNYYNDHMRYSNWHFKMGTVGDWYLLDADITTALSALSLVIYEAVANKTIKPQNFPGVGRLRRIDDNTANDAVAYGYDTNIGSLEFAVGDAGWLLGAYMGFSIYGTGAYANTNPTQAIDKQLYAGMSRSGIGNLGLTLHRVIGGDEQMAVLSMRVNRIIHRWDNPVDIGETIRRRGLELYPSARLFFGERYGLYFEAYYKFQRFNAFETPNAWGASGSGAEGVLPPVQSHVFGINIGLFMPYS